MFFIFWEGFFRVAFSLAVKVFIGAEEVEEELILLKVEDDVLFCWEFLEFDLEFDEEEEELLFEEDVVLCCDERSDERGERA